MPEIGEGIRHAKFKNYEREARLRGYAFTIDYPRFKRLTTATCAYCGNQPQPVWWKGDKAGPCMFTGIDRVNNANGYTETNTVSCCWLCNSFKGQLSTEEFTAWVNLVYAKNFSISR